MFVLFVALAFCLGIGLSALMIPKIILISFKKKLFDTVDERKVHTGIVPRLGGVAFTPAIIMTMGLLAGLHSMTIDFATVDLGLGSKFALLLCALMLLYMEGISDDLIGLGYKAKFVCQIICGVMIVCSGIYINQLYGLFGVYEMPLWAAYPFTVLLSVFIINAINLIDGIDGLSSGLSMVALFFLGCLFVMKNDAMFAIISFTTLGVLVPFFMYNVFGRAENQNKIFMGDCGSQTIGFILAVLGVKFSMDGANGDIAIPNALVVAFCVLMIPCLDVIRVMLGRMRRGKSPFLPDKTHIHHKFLALGMSHRTAMFTILMIDAFFVLFNLTLIDVLNINLVFVIDIFAFTFMHIWISALMKRRASVEKD